MFESDCSDDEVNLSYKSITASTKKEAVPLQLWAEHFSKPDKDRNPFLTKLFEKEFNFLKSLYCFLETDQVFGKTLTKFGIPNICGKINKKLFKLSTKRKYKVNKYERRNQKYLSKPRVLPKKIYSKPSSSEPNPRYPPVVHRLDTALEKFKPIQKTFPQQTYIFNDDHTSAKPNDKDIICSVTPTVGVCAEFASKTASDTNNEPKRVPGNENPNLSVSVLNEPKGLLKDICNNYGFKKCVRFNDNDLCSFAPTQEFLESLSKELSNEETSFDDVIRDRSTLTDTEKARDIVSDQTKHQGSKEAAKNTLGFETTIPSLDQHNLLESVSEIQTNLGQPFKNKNKMEPDFEVEPYDNENVVIEDFTESCSDGKNEADLENRRLLNHEPDNHEAGKECILNITGTEKINEQSSGQLGVSIKLASEVEKGVMERRPALVANDKKILTSKTKIKIEESIKTFNNTQDEKSTGRKITNSHCKTHLNINSTSISVNSKVNICSIKSNDIMGQSSVQQKSVYDESKDNDQNGLESKDIVVPETPSSDEKTKIKSCRSSVLSSEDTQTSQTTIKSLDGNVVIPETPPSNETVESNKSLKIDKLSHHALQSKVENHMQNNSQTLHSKTSAQTMVEDWSDDEFFPLSPSQPKTHDDTLNNADDIESTSLEGLESSVNIIAINGSIISSDGNNTKSHIVNLKNSLSYSLPLNDKYVENTSNNFEMLSPNNSLSGRDYISNSSQYESEEQFTTKDKIKTQNMVNCFQNSNDLNATKVAEIITMKSAYVKENLIIQNANTADPHNSPELLIRPSPNSQISFLRQTDSSSFCTPYSDQRTGKDGCSKQVKTFETLANAPSKVEKNITDSSTADKSQPNTSQDTENKELNLVKHKVLKSLNPIQNLASDNKVRKTLFPLQIQSLVSDLENGTEISDKKIVCMTTNSLKLLTGNENNETKETENQNNNSLEEQNIKDKNSVNFKFVTNCESSKLKPEEIPFEYSPLPSQSSSRSPSVDFAVTENRVESDKTIHGELQFKYGVSNSPPCAHIANEEPFVVYSPIQNGPKTNLPGDNGFLTSETLDNAPYTVEKNTADSSTADKSQPNTSQDTENKERNLVKHKVLKSLNPIQTLTSDNKVCKTVFPLQIQSLVSDLENGTEIRDKTIVCVTTNSLKILTGKENNETKETENQNNNSLEEQKIKNKNSVNFKFLTNCESSKLKPEEIPFEYSPLPSQSSSRSPSIDFAFTENRVESDKTIHGELQFKYGVSNSPPCAHIANVEPFVVYSPIQNGPKTNLPGDNGFLTSETLANAPYTVGKNTADSSTADKSQPNISQDTENKERNLVKHKVLKSLNPIQTLTSDNKVCKTVFPLQIQSLVSDLENGTEIRDKTIVCVTTNSLKILTGKENNETKETENQNNNSLEEQKIKNKNSVIFKFLTNCESSKLKPEEIPFEYSPLPSQSSSRSPSIDFAFTENRVESDKTIHGELQFKYGVSNSPPCTHIKNEDPCSVFSSIKNGPKTNLPIHNKFSPFILGQSNERKASDDIEHVFSYEDKSLEMSSNLETSFIKKQRKMQPQYLEGKNLVRPKKDILLVKAQSKVINNDISSSPNGNVILESTIESENIPNYKYVSLLLDDNSQEHQKQSYNNNKTTDTQLKNGEANQILGRKNRLIVNESRQFVETEDCTNTFKIHQGDSPTTTEISIKESTGIENSPIHTNRKTNITDTIFVNKDMKIVTSLAIEPQPLERQNVTSSYTTGYIYPKEDIISVKNPKMSPDVENKTLKTTKFNKVNNIKEKKEISHTMKYVSVGQMVHRDYVEQSPISTSPVKDETINIPNGAESKSNVTDNISTDRGIKILTSSAIEPCLHVRQNRASSLTCSNINNHSKEHTEIKITNNSKTVSSKSIDVNSKIKKRFVKLNDVLVQTPPQQQISSGVSKDIEKQNANQIGLFTWGSLGEKRTKGNEFPTLSVTSNYNIQQATDDIAGAQSLCKNESKKTYESQRSIGPMVRKKIVYTDKKPNENSSLKSSLKRNTNLYSSSVTLKPNEVYNEPKPFYPKQYEISNKEEDGLQPNKCQRGLLLHTNGTPVRPSLSSQSYDSSAYNVAKCQAPNSVPYTIKQVKKDHFLTSESTIRPQNCTPKLEIRIQKINAQKSANSESVKVDATNETKTRLASKTTNSFPLNSLSNIEQQQISVNKEIGKKSSGTLSSSEHICVNRRLSHIQHQQRRTNNSKVPKGSAQLSKENGNQNLISYKPLSSIKIPITMHWSSNEEAKEQHQKLLNESSSHRRLSTDQQWRGNKYDESESTNKAIHQHLNKKVISYSSSSMIKHQMFSEGSMKEAEDKYKSLIVSPPDSDSESFNVDEAIFRNIDKQSSGNGCEDGFESLQMSDDRSEHDFSGLIDCTNGKFSPLTSIGSDSLSNEKVNRSRSTLTKLLKRKKMVNLDYYTSDDSDCEKNPRKLTRKNMLSSPSSEMNKMSLDEKLVFSDDCVPSYNSFESAEVDVENISTDEELRFSCISPQYDYNMGGMNSHENIRSVSDHTSTMITGSQFPSLTDEFESSPQGYKENAVPVSDRTVSPFPSYSDGLSNDYSIASPTSPDDYNENNSPLYDRNNDYLTDMFDDRE